MWRLSRLTYSIHPSSGSAEALTTGHPRKPISMDTTHFSMRVRPNVYPTNIERIEIAITNHTDLEGMGGEEYFIERFDGRAWKGIPQPTAFVALGYPIFPNETRDDFVGHLDA